MTSTTPSCAARSTGTKAGDEVEVWFTGRKPGAGRVASEHFTYTVPATSAATC